MDCPLSRTRPQAQTLCFAPPSGALTPLSADALVDGPLHFSGLLSDLRRIKAKRLQADAHILLLCPCGALAALATPSGVRHS